MRVMGGTLWVMTRRFYKGALFDIPGEGTGRDGGRTRARTRRVRARGWDRTRVRASPVFVTIEREWRVARARLRFELPNLVFYVKKRRAGGAAGIKGTRNRRSHSGLGFRLRNSRLRGRRPRYRSPWRTLTRPRTRRAPP